MEFSVLPARLEFEALDDIHLPTGQQTNVFRGALGLALRKVCCQPECPGARSCPSRETCSYARFFEPIWENGPSGYRNAPRPFVLRISEQAGPIRKGQDFSADLILFDTLAPPWAKLAEAFEVIGNEGLGPSRGRAKLKPLTPPDPLRFPITGADQHGRIWLRFFTPTELKGEGDIRSEPGFDILIHRLAERIWALGRLYQGWPPEWDYRELLDLSRTVRLVNWEWNRTETSRRSSRTGQTHPIGGFTGWAEYEGQVGAFLPLLEIGRWTGVGRQTVWGKGEICVESVSFV